MATVAGMYPGELPPAFVPEGLWISLGDVARWLRCSVEEVQEILDDPDDFLEAQRMGPQGEPLFARAHLARWLASRAVPVQPQD